MKKFKKVIQRLKNKDAPELTSCTRLLDSMPATSIVYITIT